MVLIGAAAITVEEWHEKAGAILMAFYPGEQGGAALARLLLGRVNPSGKLPFTVPRDASLLPPFDNKALPVEYGYYHGYTLAEKKGWEPRYPFGHGLSYTTFAYSNLSLDSNEAEGGRCRRRVGGRDELRLTRGEEVAQLYVGFPSSKVDRPVKLLRGFERVPLAPGETKRVTFTVAAKDLAYYDVGAKGWSSNEWSIRSTRAVRRAPPTS